jgi:hypothetical protein
MMLCARDCAHDELGDQPGLGAVLGISKRRAAAGGGVRVQQQLLRLVSQQQMGFVWVAGAEAPTTPASTFLYILLTLQALL